MAMWSPWRGCHKYSEGCKHFEFRQCGTYFIKDGKRYTLKARQLISQAKKANINI